MLPLKDLQELLDKRDKYRPDRGSPEPPEEEEVVRCIHVLMARQCIYPHQTHLARPYAIMACHDYQEFFRRYFAAMGLEFHYDPRSRMISLRVIGSEKKRYDWQSARLSKSETLVLFALKLSYEEGFRTNQMGAAGDVDISTDQLFDKLETIAGLTIKESDLKQILKLYQQKGVVEVGELDPIDRVRALKILPGIEVACPEAYMEAVSLWASELPPPKPEPADRDFVDNGLQSDDAEGEEQDHV